MKKTRTIASSVYQSSLIKPTRLRRTRKGIQVLDDTITALSAKRQPITVRGLFLPRRRRRTGPEGRNPWLRHHPAEMRCAADAGGIDIQNRHELGNAPEYQGCKEEVTYG